MNYSSCIKKNYNGDLSEKMEKENKREIKFSPPDITYSEIDEVVATLKSGWITTGPKTKELERLVAEKCSVNRAVCLNSNTACAELTLRILGIGPGDEVITPAYTYTATASVVEHVGAKLVLIDCEKGKFTWDYEKLEEAINERTKVIIPVDLFGIPADYDRIYSIVEKKKKLFTPHQNIPAGQSLDCDNWGMKIQTAIGRVVVMEDAAHSFGAYYRGAPVGSISDFTNFSFHAVKNLTTAEGGSVVWKKIPGVNDEDIYKLFQLYSLHGQSKDAMSKNQPGMWEYNIYAPWFKCNMTDVHAAIGLGQIRRYDKTLEKRRQLIERYNIGLSDMVEADKIEVLDHYTVDYSSSGHLYVIRLKGKNRNDANEIMTALANYNIATNVHYKPIPLHTGYQNLGYNADHYPHAIEQFSNEITLPLHSQMSFDDVDYVVKALREAYKTVFI